MQGLGTALYPRLAPVANRWHERMGLIARFPERMPSHRAMRRRRQSRPTPLLLQYRPRRHNCLHQDLYGEHVFPLQVAVLLAEPSKDFTMANSC